MKFESRDLSIEINGVVVKVKYPAYHQFCEYLESVKDIDSSKEPMKLNEKLGEFFNKLGLAKEYYNQLDHVSVEELFNELTRKKK